MPVLPSLAVALGMAVAIHTLFFNEPIVVEGDITSYNGFSIEIVDKQSGEKRVFDGIHKCSPSIKTKFQTGDAISINLKKSSICDALYQAYKKPQATQSLTGTEPYP